MTDQPDDNLGRISRVEYGDKAIEYADDKLTVFCAALTGLLANPSTFDPNRHIAVTVQRTVDLAENIADHWEARKAKRARSDADILRQAQGDDPP